jgi:hypothetical protein
VISQIGRQLLPVPRQFSMPHLILMHVARIVSRGTLLGQFTINTATFKLGLDKVRTSGTLSDKDFLIL